MLDLKKFKQEFDEQMKSYVQKKVDYAKNILQHERLDGFMDYLLDYIFQWGKRTRPYLVYLSYVGNGGENIKEIIRFGMIFELLHTMALIHDDIVDQAKKRHNVPTIHHHIAKQIGQKNMHIAEGQTIFIGDLMLSRVYELHANSFDFDTTLLQQAKINIHGMIEEVILWEMIDVDTMLEERVSANHLEKKNIYKTAKYSFSRPMTTGAILAGARQKIIDQIEQLGIQMGLAFQVRDDLMDLVQPDQSKTTFADIQDGVQTIFTHYIYENGTTAQQQLLEKAMGQKLDETTISGLQAMLQESGAIDYGKELIANYGQNAQNILTDIDMNSESQELYSKLIQKIVHIQL